MRIRIPAVAMVAALTLALAGCSTVPEEHRGAAKGAGIGGATGAVAGAILGGEGSRVEGAVLGGLAGALIGGAVGNYTIDKEKDAEETAEKYDYQGEGTQVRIEETSVEPQEVQPGEKVELQSTYALMSPEAATPVPVTEKFEIRHEGELVGQPQATVRHDAGTYEASVPLVLPENAEAGTYQVTTTISAQGASDTRITTFTVR